MSLAKVFFGQLLHVKRLFSRNLMSENLTLSVQDVNLVPRLIKESSNRKISLCSCHIIKLGWKWHVNDFSCLWVDLDANHLSYCGSVDINKKNVILDEATIHHWIWKVVIWSGVLCNVKQFIQVDFMQNLFLVVAVESELPIFHEWDTEDVTLLVLSYLAYLDVIAFEFDRFLNLEGLRRIVIDKVEGVWLLQDKDKFLAVLDPFTTNNLIPSVQLDVWSEVLDNLWIWLELLSNSFFFFLQDKIISFESRFTSL